MNSGCAPTISLLPVVISELPGHSFLIKGRILDMIFKFVLEPVASVEMRVESAIGLEPSTA